jgi:predicted lipoprotein
MTHSTAPNPSAPKAPAPSRRGMLLGVAAIVVLAGAIALDTTVVPIGSEADVRVQAFSPDSYGQEQFPRVRAFVKEKAVDAATLAPEVLADKDAAAQKYGTASSTGAIMFVTLTGIAGEARSGVYPLTVEGVPEDITVRVQTGPAINGTDLRDAPGDIAFGDFKNQIEYQDAGSGINRAMKAAVLDGIDTSSLTGKSVTVTGAFRLINPKNWMITPVEVAVQ